MEATIKVNQIDGTKYFAIYEVRIVKCDGETITFERYLNKNDAKKEVEFIYTHLRSLCEVAFVHEQWVWC